MATRIICICDACTKELPIDEARKAAWLKLDVWWDTKMDWERKEFLYCCLECLTRDRSERKRDPFRP